METNVDVRVKPLSQQTAIPQRLYSVLKSSQRAVGSPRNTPKNIKFVSYSVYTTSSQRPYSVHTTFPQRLYSVNDVFTARKQLLQLVHSAHTARTQRSHGAHTASSVLSMLKVNAAAWRARRLHSVAGVCTARTSAFCNFIKRCGNAVMTPLWCDRGLKWNYSVQASAE